MARRAPLEKPNEFKPYTLPAPVGGLNAYDSLAVMPETDAIILQNWWPTSYGCSLRKGYIQWTTGLPSTVETVAGWYNSLGGQKLFAWSSTGMYDISSRGAVGAAMVTGLTNARWQTVVLTNASGNYMIAVNGADNGIIYRTAGVARIVLGDGITTNTWAGLDPSNAVQLTVHQKRLWAVERDTSRGWYLPPDAIQGTFVSFDFGPQFRKGGFLQFLSTWTLDDGDGADDHLVAVSSNGEAVVYAGTDPNDSTKWGLVGVYDVGSPVSGRRSFVKAGGDLLLLTQKGVVSLSAELVSTKVESVNKPIVSNKIQQLISELITTYTSINGWELVYHAPLNMVLVAVPSVTAGSNIQLAVNAVITAWTMFTGMDAACWTSHNNLLYFGDYDGVVYQAWTGNSDNVLLDNTGGSGVTAIAQQAYSYFGMRGNQKQVGLYKPTFVASGDISISSAIVYDFVDYTLPSPGAVPLPSGSLWGTGLWNSSFWSGGSNVVRNWLSAEGMGVCASIKLHVQSNDNVLWVSTDLTWKPARGVL